MRAILILAMLLAAPLATLTHPATAHADGYHNGYVENGYTWNNGYWWKGGYGYKGYKCGCNWCYTKVVKPAHHSHENHYSDQRSTVHSYDDHRIVIQNTYNYAQAAAEQGETVYGYSSVAETYGDLDIGALFNHYARLTQQSTEGSNAAVANFAALLQQTGADRARVAEILATGQAASQIAEAVKAEGDSVQQQTIQFAATIGADGSVERVERVEGDFTTQHVDIGPLIASKCVACHKPGNTSGGLDLTNWEDLSEEEWEDGVLDRITSSDPALRMPKGRDGPGEKLTPGELRQFFQAR